MSRFIKSCGIVFLSGYLSLILAISPGELKGAILESEFSSSPPNSSGQANLNLISTLNRFGLSRREALSRLAALPPEEIASLISASRPIIRGGGVQYPYQGEVNEPAAVIITLVAIAGGVAVWAHLRNVKDKD